VRPTFCKYAYKQILNIKYFQMKRLFMLAFLLVSTLGLFAQVTTVTDANARPREVGSFTGVKVSSGIELLLQQGDKDAVAVSSSKPEYHNRIKTVVEGGVLKIYIDDFGSKWRKNVKFRAYVSIRQLEKLIASSGATAKTGRAINIAKLVLDASSGANIEGEFKGQSISSDNSSGAITKLKGAVENLQVETSSGAIFKGFELSSSNCSADASSGGLIDIMVTKELSAEASSGGSINYKGGGVIRNLRTGSGGSVKSNS
jgi:Putative auto-transporter adhesin, head GIN domain